MADASPPPPAPTASGGSPAVTRFATDSSLALLARRLRMLGYDILVLSGARLEEVFEVALREDRVVLTTSARHPRRFARVVAQRVSGTDLAATLRGLTERHAPTGIPFSRCSECNTALQRRHPMEASGEVPGRVLRAARALAFCPGCGRWYWDGSHVARLRAWFERALGRPVGPP